MDILIEDKIKLFNKYGKKKMLINPSLNLLADYVINLINNIKTFIPH